MLKFEKQSGLWGKIETACPEAIVLRDRDGNIEMVPPCGKEDCVSAECRRMARLREIASVPDLFADPKALVAHKGQGMSREESLAALEKLSSAPAPVVRLRPELGVSACGKPELLFELAAEDRLGPLSVIGLPGPAGVAVAAAERTGTDD